MAGERIPVYNDAGRVTVEANGSSITAGAVGTANDANYVCATDGGGFEGGYITIKLPFATAPTANRTVSVIAQPRNVISTNHGPTPVIGRQQVLLGQIRVNNGTGDQYHYVRAWDLPREFTLYLANNTDQTIGSGWEAYITPMSEKAA